jgi:uncharacterized protein
LTQHIIFPQSTILIVAVIGALLFSGIVKGILGIGLPLTAVPLLNLLIDLPSAIALLTIPLFLSNVSQALQGEGTIAVSRELLPILVPLLAGILLGAELVLSLDYKVLLGGVGAFLLVSTIFMFAAPKLTIPRQFNGWLAPFVGFLSGIMGGIAALYGPPLISYMVARGLNQQEFVKKISILYTFAAAVMIVAFTGFGAMAGRDWVISSFAMVPVFLGMRIGESGRTKLAPQLFRNLVLVVVLISAVQMILKSFL